MREISNLQNTDAPTEICEEERRMKEYIVSQKYIDGIYTDEGSTFGLDMQKELIRCKDCKHWQCDDSESYCDELGIFNTDMNSYCSYAKRKEE